MKDVGASISIVNKEFLQDTQATTLAQVLLFTPNTEVAGLNGNYSAAQYAGAGNLIPEGNRDNQTGGFTRIRGLAGADLTRNYFATSIPFDTYAVDRVEVQRGANSVLFGLGSPGGIVNNTMIAPDLRKNANRVRVEADQNGSLRGSFRSNIVLMEDTLAISVAGLYQKGKFEQKEAWQDDQRLYAAIDWKITEGIHLWGNYETGVRDSSRPDFVPPNDGITPWLQTGKIIWDHPADAGTWYDKTGSVIPGVANPRIQQLTTSGISVGYANWYGDVNDPNPTSIQGTYTTGAMGLPNFYPETSGRWMNLQPVNAYDIVRRTGFWPDGTAAEPGHQFFAAGFVGQQLLDRSIFDYRKHLFSGGSSTQHMDWDVYQVGASGSWFEDRLGLELAYHNEKEHDSGKNALQGLLQRTIFIDTNRLLIAPVVAGDDGTGALMPNPNFGKPSMGGLYGGNYKGSTREDYRATAFGELKASDMMEEGLVESILGRLRVTGVYEQRKNTSYEYYSRDQVNATATARALTDSGGIYDVPHYIFRTGSQFQLPYSGNVDFLGATTLSDLSGADIGAVPFGDLRTRTPAYMTDVVGWNSDTATFASFDTPSYNLEDTDQFPAAFYAGKRDTNIDSQVLVGQWYIWDDTLVLMGSWRNDVSKTAGVGAPGSRLHPRADATYDPAFVAGPQDLQENANVDTTSWSAMLHTPQFIKDSLPWGSELSFYYSESENFQATGGNVTILNDPIPPISGSTTEKGFIISTMNGKLVGRFNWYETGILNKRFDVGGVSSNEGILLNLVRQLDLPENVAQGFTRADVEAVLPPQGVIDVNQWVPYWDIFDAETNRNSADSGTQDFVSTGFEWEITYNPSANWTHMLTVGNQETITSNTYPVLQQYVEDFVIPTWVNSNFAQNYFMGSSLLTLAETATNNIVLPVAKGVTQDGNPQIEQRKYRVTYNTSYAFGNDSFMPDWLGQVTLGGGIRWQDKVGVGFGVSMNEFGDYVQDVDKPIYGGEMFNLDLFWRSTWFLQNEQSISVQLNITDVTAQGDLVPIYANPDGSKTYRFTEGRMFKLMGTWEF